MSVSIGTQPLLRISQVSKSFAGNQALADVDLEVRPGEIVGLLGANGAGKSTLIKILAGVYQRDAGEITFSGGGQGGDANPHRNIAFLHQDLAVVGTMTVAENIALQSGFSRRGPLISWQRTEERALACLQKLGADIRPDLTLNELTASESAIVAIARALSLDAAVLVLDEPTATLSAGESKRLLTALRKLQESGVGMLFVSHHLQEVLDVTDRVVVLRDGRVVMESKTDAVKHDELVEAITGRKYVPSSRSLHLSEAGKSLIEVSDLVTDRAGPVSFELRTSEICVLTGLVGAGQHELGRSLVGDKPIYSGQARFTAGGHSVTDRGGRRQICFASGDRAREATSPGLTVRENLTMSPPAFRSRKREQAAAFKILAGHDVRPPQTELAIGTLSGGNQQKVVVARAVELDAPVLIFEDPTGGVDIGARQQIYKRLREEAEGGRSILVVTSDFEEAALVGSRVLVLRDGRIVDTLIGESINELEIMNLATGKEAEKE
ncbi:ATP-binding cassette domain-containing protein [Pseudarthrobacter sp. AG30]|uniref:sugar ABC transporter ATP-binding protein n=1 Tax=Pseudarthrobacter sp. AG30 TaxID=2249742 RepID=UPI000D6DE084|nr:sugar ABC transporter ATP-binding protein [Pseudarthrobacter sp. AG30]RAX15123.1 ATP-binding cassette domain-containing protein [Pseudarthrobacter sp. AG30]